MRGLAHRARSLINLFAPPETEPVSTMGGMLSRIPRPALHARFPFLFIVNRRLTHLVSPHPAPQQALGGHCEAGITPMGNVSKPICCITVIATDG